MTIKEIKRQTEALKKINEAMQEMFKEWDIEDGKKSAEEVSFKKPSFIDKVLGIIFDDVEDRQYTQKEVLDQLEKLKRGVK